MTKFFVLICFTLLVFNSWSQNTFKPDEYYLQQSARAFSFYNDNKYAEAALTLDSLFDNYKGQASKEDRYIAACSWALAGNADKAFAHLNKAIVIDNWTNPDNLTSDPDLISLQTDKRWQKIIETVRANKEKAEIHYNKPLVAILDTIYREDQGERQHIDSIQNLYGWQSKQIDSLWKIIHFKDSINLLKVKNIIDKYGWLGPDIIGRDGATTLFLVIQHADTSTQVNYVSAMREAVKQGKAEANQLALLEDRILTSQGKKQIYGSQVKTNETTGKNEFFPIADEPLVNKRRASVGLGPLEEYAKLFGIDYELPKPR